MPNINLLIQSLERVPTRRGCIREEFVQAEGFYQGAVSYGYTVKVWTYHYSDGTEEMVTLRERHK